MKPIVIGICMILAFGLIACENTEAANDKIDECLEEKYSEEEAEEHMSNWELDCEDGEEECDECVACIMDEECEDILDNACSDKCE